MSIHFTEDGMEVEAGLRKGAVLVRLAVWADT